MTTRRILPLLTFTIIVMVLLIYAPSNASDGNRVAVVVDFGNGQVASRCVEFVEESITGYEALERTGLPVETDIQTGSAAICRIDGQGCPPNDCFCSCRGGGDCKYWSYWHLIDGVWNYSAAGSGLYQVSDGMVDGWVWGLGSVTQATPPPVIRFADVCLSGDADTPTATSSPTMTRTPVVLPTVVPPSDNPVVNTATSTIVASVPSSSVPTHMPTATLANLPELTRPVAPISSPTSMAVSASVLGDDADEATPDAPALLLATPDEPIGALDDAPPVEIVTSAPTPTLPGQEGYPPAIDEMIIAEAHINGPAMESENLISAATSGTSSEPQPAAVGVVGGDATLNDESVMQPYQAEHENVNWLHYAGFAGLLLFLVALALLVFRRRTGEPGEPINE